jgi:hypothetical protein
MAKKPSFQFYPGDWRKDQNLSRASLQAKGALIEVLCLAFECEKRGLLKTGKHAWTIEEIAHAIGGDKIANISAIEELLTLKVLKKDKKNAIFSSRMVRDEKLSKVRRMAGFRGGNPILLNQSANQTTTPSTSSSTSSSDTLRAGLQNSNLFRKPKIPTKNEVLEIFKSGGGTKEMAREFWNKYEATEWYLNGSPVKNVSALAQRFIMNWNHNHKNVNGEEYKSGPTLPIINKSHD